MRPTDLTGNWLDDPEWRENLNRLAAAAVRTSSPRWNPAKWTESVLRQFGPFIRREIKRQTHGRAMDDAWQEVAAELAAQAGRFDLEADGRFTYLANAVKAALRRLRIRGRGYTGLSHASWKTVPEAPVAHTDDSDSVIDEGFEIVAGNIGEPVERTDAKRDLRAMLKRIPVRSRKVLRMRMRGLTLEEVGAKLGITKERVRQIEADAVRKLRGPTKKA